MDFRRFLDDLRWLEDIYALKNPPPPRCFLIETIGLRSVEEYGDVQAICLGGLCSACSRPVCVDEQCSLLGTTGSLKPFSSLSMTFLSLFEQF